MYRQEYMIGDIVVPSGIFDDEHPSITDQDLLDFGKIIISIMGYPGGVFKYFGIRYNLFIHKSEYFNIEYLQHNSESIQPEYHIIYSQYFKRPAGIYCQDCPMRSVMGICESCCDITHTNPLRTEHFQLRDKVNVFSHNYLGKKEILGKILINKIYLYSKPKGNITESHIRYGGIILSCKDDRNRDRLNLLCRGVTHNSLRLWNRSDTIISNTHINTFCKELCIYRTKDCYKTCKLLNYV